MLEDDGTMEHDTSVYFCNQWIWDDWGVCPALRETYLSYADNVDGLQEASWLESVSLLIY